MYTPDDCSAAPSLFAWSRDARPVRLVVVSPRPARSVPEAGFDFIDDLLFGFSVAALLLVPLSLVASTLLS